MGFFAVLRDPDDEAFKVLECHVNLWSLAALVGRTFYWDVGLRIGSAAGKPVAKIQLALPFGTFPPEEAGIEDLRDRILNPQTAHLIFGRPIKTDGETIDWGKGRVRIVNVPRSDAERLPNRSGRDFPFWKLKLTPPIAGQTEGYLRIRFPVKNPGRLWRWKRSLFARNGALVDVRLYDVREAHNVAEWQAYEHLMVEMEKLNVFVIAPSLLQHRGVSPPLHYLRLLEGDHGSPTWGALQTSDAPESLRSTSGKKNLA